MAELRLEEHHGYYWLRLYTTTRKWQPHPGAHDYTDGGTVELLPGGRAKFIPSESRKKAFHEVQNYLLAEKRTEELTQFFAKRRAGENPPPPEFGKRQAITQFTTKARKKHSELGDEWAEQAATGIIDPRRCVFITLGSPVAARETPTAELFTAAKQFKSNLEDWMRYFTLGRSVPYGRPLVSCIKFTIEAYPGNLSVPHAHCLVYFPDLTEDEFQHLPDLVEKNWLAKYPGGTEWIGDPVNVQRCETAEDVKRAAHYHNKKGKPTYDNLGSIGARAGERGRKYRPEYVRRAPVKLDPIQTVCFSLTGAEINKLPILDGRPVTYETAPEIPSSLAAAEKVADLILAHLTNARESGYRQIRDIGQPEPHHGDQGRFAAVVPTLPRGNLVRALLNMGYVQFVGRSGGQDMTIPLGHASQFLRPIPPPEPDDEDPAIAAVTAVVTPDPAPILAPVPAPVPSPASAVGRHGGKFVPPPPPILQGCEVDGDEWEPEPPRRNRRIVPESEEEEVGIPEVIRVVSPADCYRQIEGPWRKGETPPPPDFSD